MSPKTVIFIGPSGSGKTTQANLLIEYIKKNQKGESIYSLETGKEFREFIKENKYSNRMANEIYNVGKRLPDFLAVYIWSHLFVENIKGQEHILIDGTPRSLNEAIIFDTALEFYDKKPAFVVFLDSKRQSCFARLFSRGRTDDKKEKIEKRLDWYKRDVFPAVKYYKKNPDYIFIKINGDKAMEEISAEIIEKIFNS